MGAADDADATEPLGGLPLSQELSTCTRGCEGVAGWMGWERKGSPPPSTLQGGVGGGLTCRQKGREDAPPVYTGTAPSQFKSCKLTASVIHTHVLTLTSEDSAISGPSSSRSSTLISRPSASSALSRGAVPPPSPDPASPPLSPVRDPHRPPGIPAQLIKPSLLPPPPLSPAAASDAPWMRGTVLPGPSQAGGHLCPAKRCHAPAAAGPTVYSRGKVGPEGGGGTLQACMPIQLMNSSAKWKSSCSSPHCRPRTE